MPVSVWKKMKTVRAVIKFDFEHVEAKKVKDVVCPLCGGEIVQTPFGFGCANYTKDESGELPFLHWKNGREITDRITGERTC